MKIKIAKNIIKILMDLEFLTLESFSETVLGKIRYIITWITILLQLYYHAKNEIHSLLLTSATVIAPIA